MLCELSFTTGQGVSNKDWRRTMIFANINIKSLLKPIKVVLFASLLSVSISQNLSAKEIICGNTKCDIEAY